VSFITRLLRTSVWKLHSRFAKYESARPSVETWKVAVYRLFIVATCVCVLRVLVCVRRTMPSLKTSKSTIKVKVKFLPDELSTLQHIPKFGHSHKTSAPSSTTWTTGPTRCDHYLLVIAGVAQQSIKSRNAQSSCSTRERAREQHD
jgi:hypothetical protein